MTGFADLPERILGPLEGVSDAAWHDSPDGRWGPGQIVAHLAVAMENSATAFESRVDKPPMERRPVSLVLRVARLVVFTTGRFPRGRKAPPTALPPVRPERAATEDQFRRAVERFLALERRLLPQRERDLFVKHPVFGDLTLREFMRFHVVHAEHHRRQILERLG